MDKLNKHWLKAIVFQFSIYIIMLTLIAVTSAVCSCSEDSGAETYRGDIVGSYIIEETNETITFEKSGVWYIDESKVYPEDDVFGNFVSDEGDSRVDGNNTYYCFYYIESEDKDFVDTMKLSWSFDGCAIGVGVPTHGKNAMTLKRVN